MCVRPALTLFFSFVIVICHAQKGIPSATPTQASVHTNFPQHVDFKPEMVKQLKVPEGFRVFVAAQGLGKPRMMAENKAGQLYITRRDQGDVLVLSDTDQNGSMDKLATATGDFPGVHGIAIRDSFIYLCSNRELKRGTIDSIGMIYHIITLIDNLPDGGQHPNRTIAFGPDNLLYISVGSDCNDCGESNKEHATMLTIKPDGTDRKIFARGLRNTIGFDWHPVTKALWGADNGTDWRGDDKPHEELNQIMQHADYGWPLVYDAQQVDSTREDPAGTTKAAYAMKTVAPALLFPAHAAPISFIFPANTGHTKNSFGNDALISFHGSWNRKNPEGFAVKRIRYDNGKPVAVTDFLTGFFDTARNTRFGRPAGLFAAGSGIVYVTDDANGILYGISPVK